MREERIENGGVPARLYDPGDARGVLLLGHGGERSKDSERFVRLAREYAARTGLAVVCIDAVDHGERRPTAPSTGLPSRWHSGAADQMTRDWQITAAALSSLGPTVAYVGFSMGAIFGAFVVASLPGIRAAVFGVGGIPSGGGIDDPPLRGMLLDAAARLGEPQILMLNLTGDEVFRPPGAHEFFDAIPGPRKRLTFWGGAHDEWPPEMIRSSIEFINQHTH